MTMHVILARIRIQGTYYAITTVKKGDGFVVRT